MRCLFLGVVIMREENIYGAVCFLMFNRHPVEYILI